MRSSGSSTALAVAAAAVDEDPVTWKRQNQCRYRVTDKDWAKPQNTKRNKKNGWGVSILMEGFSKAGTKSVQVEVIKKGRHAFLGLVWKCDHYNILLERVLQMSYSHFPFQVRSDTIWKGGEEMERDQPRESRKAKGNTDFVRP